MIDVPVYNTAGEKVDTVQVDEQQLGGEVRPALIKQAIVMYHANQRQGTHKTKGRGEVQGSGKKMYRQKGTGNARMGKKNNPIRRGGGHAKQKLPKDWSQDMPKKQRRLATKNALLAKFQDGSVKIVDDIDLPEVKTKHMAGYWKALGLDRTVLFALPNADDHKAKNADLFRAGRNLAETRFTSVAQLNAWDVLRNRVVLLTRAGFDQLLAA
ncbi:MAG: 50S ribosomal protein L4 [Planctomycetota bacterium]